MAKKIKTKTTTKTTTDAPAPTDAPRTPQADVDLTKEEAAYLADHLLLPPVFATLVDGLPAGAERTSLKMWGSLRGLYPAEATYDQRLGPPRPRPYELQPTGVPELAAVTLEGDEVLDVFQTIVDAVKVWEHPDDVLEEDQAYIRLIGLAEALRVMTRAVRDATSPLAGAHWEDRQAAREWEYQRWSARSRLARRQAEAGARDTTEAAQPGADASRTDTPTAAGSSAAPPAPAAAAAPVAGPPEPSLKDGTNG